MVSKIPNNDKDIFTAPAAPCISYDGGFASHIPTILHVAMINTLPTTQQMPRSFHRFVMAPKSAGPAVRLKAQFHRSNLAARICDKRYQTSCLC